jgi:hypothetical protein
MAFSKLIAGLIPQSSLWGCRKNALPRRLFIDEKSAQESTAFRMAPPTGWHCLQDGTAFRRAPPVEEL